MQIFDVICTRNLEFQSQWLSVRLAYESYFVHKEKVLSLCLIHRFTEFFSNLNFKKMETLHGIPENIVIILSKKVWMFLLALPR